MPSSFKFQAYWSSERCDQKDEVTIALVCVRASVRLRFRQFCTAKHCAQQGRSMESRCSFREWMKLCGLAGNPFRRFLPVVLYARGVLCRSGLNRRNSYGPSRVDGPDACRCHVRVVPLQGYAGFACTVVETSVTRKKQMVQGWAAFASRCFLQKIALVAADLVDPGPSTFKRFYVHQGWRENGALPKTTIILSRQELTRLWCTIDLSS